MRETSNGHEPQRGDWADLYWTSFDGLKLYYRDYAGPADRPLLLCLHGLTRNSRDFAEFAERYAGEWRIIAPDFRGRGLSQWDPTPENYKPPVYAADVLQLMGELGVREAIFVGTSLGGLVTMAIAAFAPQRIAATILNDVGPELDPAGIERIGNYVGTPVAYESWEAAATSLAEAHRARHPNYGAAEWAHYARRICTERDGVIVFDYDMGIVENFRAAQEAPAVDAWPYFLALSGAPLLILRGEHSDLLSASGAQAMVDRHPHADLVTVPNVGHAPDLTEPAAVTAIDRFLARKS
jgi:pimeloyl-ACP methyl ester carboxylesterase